MDDEQLLECVRKYPVVYVKSHPKYLDNKHKNVVRKTILDEMKQSKDACKRRWANIRDQFKKHINKRKTKSGQGAVLTKKYRYEDNLNFLLPYIQNRNSITSIETEDEEILNETEAVQSTQATTRDETAMANTDKGQQQQRSPTTTANFTLPTDTNPNLPSTSFITQNRKRNVTGATVRNRRTQPQSQPSASNTLMDYIIKKIINSPTYIP